MELKADFLAIPARVLHPDPFLFAAIPLWFSAHEASKKPTNTISPRYFFIVL